MDNIDNIQPVNNDSVNEAPARKRGTVNNFGFLNETGLTFIKNDLGLSMSMTHLNLCVNHYRAYERRNPTIDELYFLDELVRTYGIRGDNLAVTSLEASSQQVFDTFKDFEERYSKRPKSPNGLITYNDIVSFGFDVTDAIGKPHILDDNEALIYSNDELAVEFGTYLESRELSEGLKHCKLNQVKVFKERANDLAVMIYCDTEDKERMYKIASEYSRHGVIKVHRSMATEGVMHSLLKLFNRGVFVAFDAFPVGMFNEMEELCKVFGRTFYIARLSNKDLPFFKSECTRLGVKCCLIGYGINDTLIKVGRRDHSVIFSLHREIFARLDIPLATVARINNTPSLSSYGKVKVHNTEDFACFSVKSCGDNAFFGTVNTLASAVGTAIAHGYSLNEIEMCVTLRLPTFDGEKYNNCNYLGYALACYRVVAELGLNGNGRCVIDTTIQNAILEATVYSKRKPDIKAPSTKAISGSLYLLNPMSDNSSVSFAQIKGVIEYITRLIHAGAARRISFVGGQTLGQIVEEINIEYKGVNVDPALDCEYKIPFAFLVETDGKLNGKLIAYYSGE